MPDFAGAKAAIRARLVAGWSATRIAFQNEHPAAPWPPVDGDGVLQPWVLLEIAGGSQEIAGFGSPGKRPWRYDGRIEVHVFAPVSEGDAIATAHAVAIGELFRAAKFYDETPGYCIRTLAPSIDGGGSGDDDGAWFRVTMTCPFTYWHRA